MNRLKRVYQPLFTILAAALLASPTLATAQPAPARPVTPQSLALTAADLGPDWSMCCHSTPSGLYQVLYTNPTGGEVQIYTGIGASTDDTDQVVSGVRDLRQAAGATIKSVQDQGFGDGRAFESEFNDGQKAVVSYMFRVHTLFASVDYRGPARAGDAAAQALTFSRKQEAKLWAATAPTPAQAAPAAGPATALPAPVVVATPAPVAAPAPTPIAAAPVAPAAAVDPYCRSGEQPAFHFGFAELRATLGTSMGNASSCEYGDPRGSGDTLQATSKGLSFYRQRSNTPTFTTGFEHWALTATGVVYWTGDGIDPPESAQLVGYTGAVHAGSAANSTSR